jgi:hypothetical protein
MDHTNEASGTQMNARTITHIYKTSVWIENDMMGARHVVVQHEAGESFTYCSFHYGYGYTDNASTLRAATTMALSLGATEPIEQRRREMPMPSRAEVMEQIEDLQSLLEDCADADESQNKTPCWCTTCHPTTMADMRFVVCPDCGNKRCPKAHNHTLACTNSNAVGQAGSSWADVKPFP